VTYYLPVCGRLWHQKDQKSERSYTFKLKPEAVQFAESWCFKYMYVCEPGCSSRSRELLLEEIRYVLSTVVASGGGSGRMLVDMQRRNILSQQQSACGDDRLRTNERRRQVIRSGSSFRRLCFRFLRALEFPVRCRRVARLDASFIAGSFVCQRSQRHANICQSTDTLSVTQA